jgi:hypothetical protein
MLPGSGNTGSLSSPAVCVHAAGWPPVKSMLWALPPDGYANVTVPPAAIVTVFSSVAGFLNP